MTVVSKTKQFTFQCALLLVFLVFSNVVRAQITVGFQGGEPGDTWTYSSTGASALAQSEATLAPNKVTGTKSIVVGGNTGGGNCFDSGSGNGPDVQRTFTFDPLDISTSNQFARTLTFSWGNRFPTCTGTGWDSNEDLRFQAILDGVPQTVTTIQSGNNNAGFSIQTHQYTYTIPACVSEFEFVVYVTTNRADELLFLDNVKVTTPQLNASLSQPSPIVGNTSPCPGNIETYSVTAVSGLNYTWSGLPAGASFTTTNGTATSNTMTVNWGTAPAGTYTLVVTPTDACGNAGPTQTITVVVSGSPTPISISGPTSLCSGETIVLTSSISSGITWSTGATTQSIDVSSPGTYSVSVTTSCGVQTATYTVSLNAGPEITEVLTQDVSCFGATDGSLTVVSPVSNLEYSLNGSVWQTSNSFTSLEPGTYVVEVQTASGCSNSATAQINEPAQLMVSATSVGPYCVGESIELNASTTVSGSIDYYWTGPNGYTSTLQNPSNASASGTYSVTATTPLGCTGTATIEVLLHEKPIPQFTSSTVCFGLSTEFTSSGSTVPSPEVIASYSWDFGDGSTVNTPNAEHEYASSGNFQVTLELTTANGCSASITQTIEVIPAPIANFSFTPLTASVSEPEVTFINTTQNGGAYLWIFDELGNSSQEVSPVYTYPQEEYEYVVTLIAYNAEGCTDTVQKIVTIGDGLIYYVPNSFTPNADGMNETFTPVFTSGFDATSFKMEIYNRWGELVFESTDVNQGWDGKVEGLIAPDGTYIWTIRFKHLKDDGKKSLSGHVVLLR